MNLIIIKNQNAKNLFTRICLFGKKCDIPYKMCVRVTHKDHGLERILQSRFY